MRMRRPRTLREGLFAAAGAGLAAAVLLIVPSAAGAPVVYKTLVDMPAIKIRLEDMDRHAKEVARIIAEDGGAVETGFMVQLKSGEFVKTADILSLKDHPDVPATAHLGGLNVSSRTGGSGPTFVSMVFEPYTNYYSIDTQSHSISVAAKVAMQRFIRKYRRVYLADARPVVQWGFRGFFAVLMLAALFAVRKASLPGAAKMALYAVAVVAPLAGMFYFTEIVEPGDLLPSFTLVVRHR